LHFLINDGATLWFSAIVGSASTANLTNTRLALALANSSFSSSNYSYVINNEGPQAGVGVGFTFGRLTDETTASANGKFAATLFRDPSFGTSGFSGNIIANAPATALAVGQTRLIVAKITWGATSDTIETYEPDSTLALGQPASTLTVNVNHSTFDTLTFARGEATLLDEIRFGPTYQSVLTGNTAMLTDTTPPTPASAFLMPPQPSSGLALQMTAVTAYDPHGVEYRFICTAGGGPTSAWQTSPSYTTTALQPGAAYSYAVQTRDLSPARNESALSSSLTARIPAAYAHWQSSNAATASAADDHDADGVPNGIEYFLGGNTATTGFTALPPVTPSGITWTRSNRYPGLYGADYLIETTTDLTGPWTPEPLGSNVIVTGNTLQYLFPPSNPLNRRFVRLKVLLP
jgi:hypothetical protein